MVVFGMRADPIPDYAFILSDSQSPIIQTDANRIDIGLTLDLLEMKPWVGRISPEYLVGTACILLHRSRQA